MSNNKVYRRHEAEWQQLLGSGYTPMTEEQLAREADQIQQGVFVATKTYFMLQNRINYSNFKCA